MPLQLFDYQAQGADLMAARPRFGLHDEMGIGKTATTIGTMDRLGAQRGVIVAPAMLRENWIKEFRKFSIYDRRLCKGQTIHDFIAWTRGRFDVLVTSYELMTKWSQKFMEEGEVVDFMAFDEAHYLKNHATNRSKALLGEEADGTGITLYAQNAYHVTGTPMANDPMDIFTFLRFTGAMDLDAREFVKTFFNESKSTYGTRNTPKPEMVEPLKQLIYNNCIRRTHADVGMDLPPIWLKEVLIEGSHIELQKAIDAYGPHLEETIIEALEGGTIENLSADYIAVIRRLIGKAKAVAYAELLKMELDAGAGKRVVYCWHTEPLLHVAKYLRKFGYGAVTVYGGTTTREAEDAVTQFMNDPNCHVFIGNIKKAGTGLTLTESCEIDMLESDWSPAGNAQAIKRVHRYGQRQSVTARFITLANSIDVAVNKTVASKTATIANIEGNTMTAAPLDVL